MSRLDIISWNVNGYRDLIHDYLKQFILSNEPDIIFLSETKKSKEFLLEKFSEFTDYQIVINSHIPWRYHGVAMLIKKDHAFQSYPLEMNIPLRRDSQGSDASIGRVILTLLNQKMFILGVYTPNSGGIQDAAKYSYRVETWDPCFKKILNMISEKGPTVYLGDLNVALDDIDVSNKKVMCKWPGFTPRERENFREVLACGKWCDIFRKQHPKKKCYTWRGNCPTGEYGLRLDNILVTNDLEDKVVDSYVVTSATMASDHVPVGIII